MNEFWLLLKKFDLKGIFIRPTANAFLQFVRYAFVGGIATVADWGSFSVFFYALHLNDVLSSALGFVVGLIINFVLSKILVFKGDQAKTGVGGEFIGYVVIGLIGLALTMLLMLLFTDVCKLEEILGKIFSTCIVLPWNYFARKIFLYRKKEQC